MYPHVSSCILHVFYMYLTQRMEYIGIHLGYIMIHVSTPSHTHGDESDEVEEVRVPAAIDVEREVQQGDTGTSNEGNARRW